VDTAVLPRALERLYELGLRPDWWKLPPAAPWPELAEILRARDPHCHGILILGLEAAEQELAKSFAAAAGTREVRGFAVGRTLFAEAARRWLAGEIDDEVLVGDVAARTRRLVEAWHDVRRP
jgi:5-dehydro-2-deoxygluconokinase